MEKATRILLDSCYEICNIIETSGLGLKNKDYRVIDLYRYDLLCFLTYLATSNNMIDKAELRFINNELKFNYTVEDLYAFRSNNEITKQKFLSSPPRSLDYFLLADDNREMINTNKYYYRAKQYVTLINALGKDFIACNGDYASVEIEDFTRYCLMIDSYINRHNNELYNNKNSYTYNVPDQNTSQVNLFLKSQDSSNEGSYGYSNSESNAQTAKADDQKGENTKTQEKPKPATTKTVDELISELNQLTGLEEVKQDVTSLVNLIKIRKMREDRGLKVAPIAMHLVFSGNPGTGKTTVARLMAQIYCSLGILSKGHLVEVDRSSLVAGYMGQTAEKVQEIVKKSQGGVLFIDEAYSLTNSKMEGDFGQEAIDTLIKAMEDKREEFIVIVAGYPEPMKEFLKSNPGLKSRFNKFINFTDYSNEELFMIFEQMCMNMDYTLNFDGKAYAKQFFANMVSNKNENFANARDVRTFLEKAISNQATRLSQCTSLDNNALMTLRREDMENIVFHD